MVCWELLCSMFFCLCCLLLCFIFFLVRSVVSSGSVFVRYWLLVLVFSVFEFDKEN